MTDNSSDNSMEVRQNIVVFTGAGISKESGIPTFRDMGHGRYVEEV